MAHLVNLKIVIVSQLVTKLFHWIGCKTHTKASTYNTEIIIVYLFHTTEIHLSHNIAKYRTEKYDVATRRSMKRTNEEGII